MGSRARTTGTGAEVPSAARQGTTRTGRVHPRRVVSERTALVSLLMRDQ
ncbi:hypothetical protein [Actinopolymorpha cephalotaxi]|uniref:Uncharacterized protein n=1 Tax=Actinopolymorpha cephalotaxi TaxID=504797 RepID=A0ABX2S897_9ACTN|nr:hypothetical protein [Actinopolymorpha cephalotaxi]NYH84436.1 hypothetical protein [Actinopolymorpha cephalotaxi]